MTSRAGAGLTRSRDRGRAPPVGSRGVVMCQAAGVTWCSLSIYIYLYISIAIYLSSYRSIYLCICLSKTPAPRLEICTSSSVASAGNRLPTDRQAFPSASLTVRTKSTRPDKKIPVRTKIHLSPDVGRAGRILCVLMFFSVT